MASINKAILIGNLGQDPELKYLPSGDAVCNFTIATTDTWKDREGIQQERTEWHNIVAFKRLAEICGEYLKKGKQIYVEGRIRTRTWDDQNGVKRYMTEIVVNEMKMLGRRDDVLNGGDYSPPPQQKTDSASAPLDDDDDLPF